MNNHYKITRYAFGYPCGENEYPNFESAKAAMFATLLEKNVGLKDLKDRCLEMIDSYCAEYYPDGAPESFGMLKEFLSDYLDNPEAMCTKVDELSKTLYFEDEKLEFGFGTDWDENGQEYTFFATSRQDEIAEKFPDIWISTFNINELSDPEDERCVYIHAGNWGCDISLTLSDE